MEWKGKVPETQAYIIEQAIGRMARTERNSLYEKSRFKMGTSSSSQENNIIGKALNPNLSTSRLFYTKDTYCKVD